MASLALWCTSCYSSEIIEQRLCHGCIDKVADDSGIFTCVFCRGKLSDSLPHWASCTKTDCLREVLICDPCEKAFGSGAESAMAERPGVACMAHWIQGGRMCIVCGVTSARMEKVFGHRCKQCVSEGKDAAFLAKLAAEAQEWLDDEARRLEQRWDGSEPALQLLMLPRPSPVPLASYADTPEPLHPKHCRLCMHDVHVEHGVSKASAAGGSATPMARHLRSAHDNMTERQYRTAVLEDALESWPQPISPQILRARLAGFKAELTDANYRMEACACCARGKKRVKLQEVCLPLPDAEECPAWLSFTIEEWRMHGTKWYDSLDTLFNIEFYMDRGFKIPLKLEHARQEVEKTIRGEDTGHSSVSVAEAWLARVQAWAGNIRAALEADSVPAPGKPGERWLLYHGHGRSLRALPCGSLMCLLCKKCATSLRTYNFEKNSKKERVSMPEYARANCLWGGPEPQELKDLVFAERKVIQLARAYICVKRVIVTGSRPAAAAEAPKYHERNVVAYPQNPDAVRRLVGLLPLELCEVIAVQFVGASRSDVLQEPTLMVSVTRLRRAFVWLLGNCWPWLHATKYERSKLPDDLGDRLESLLAAYRASTGCAKGGVPAELVQGATKIAAEQAPLQQSGPANAVDPGEAREDMPLNDSAAVLQGNMDRVISKR